LVRINFDIDFSIIGRKIRGRFIYKEMLTSALRILFSIFKW